MKGKGAVFGFNLFNGKGGTSREDFPFGLSSITIEHRLPYAVLCCYVVAWASCLPPLNIYVLYCMCKSMLYRPPRIDGNALQAC